LFFNSDEIRQTDAANERRVPPISEDGSGLETFATYQASQKGIFSKGGEHTMGKLWRAALWTGAAFAFPAVINLAIARNRRDLITPLPGEEGEYGWPLGRIHYQVRGDGEPLVLVHGVGAGNSSYEFRYNFDALSEQSRVYAYDLPGFGKSERRNQTYTADMFVLALMDFLRDVVKEPAHVVASSLSAAHAISLAARRPELIKTLTLICPTGIQDLVNRVPVWSQFAYGAFSLPAVGTSLYNGIASYAYIESFLKENVYYDVTMVTPALVEQFYQTAHQPNGQYALRSFISGLLNCDIAPVYPQLRQPVFIAWGRHAKQTPVEHSREFYEQHPHSRLRIFEESRLLPHNEEAEDFNAAVLSFLRSTEVSPTKPAALTQPAELPSASELTAAPELQP
jgi:pimeloyl-ACP methyl ester carboxylesterase